MNEQINILDESNSAGAVSNAPVPVVPLPISILVADDDLINRKVIERALAKLGYTCDIVDNGRKAVESANSKKYQLIFLDMMMPEMDGYEAAGHIAAAQSGKLKPIIVALTAHAPTDDKENVLTIGIDDYVTKPYKLQDIQDMIQKWEQELLSKL
jgi:CheY-like chemotaxis protein